MTAINLSFLNKDVDTDVLVGYMDLLCTAKFDLKDFKIRRDKMREAIESVRSGAIYTIHYRNGKYVWKKGLSLSEKRQIIGFKIARLP